jgi:hypothetical protein
MKTALKLLLAGAGGLGGMGGGLLRTVPDTADSFYLVVRNNDGTADAIRFQRNVGGAAGADLGGMWPEWRFTGRARLASFFASPTSPTVTFTTDTGAQDIVGFNGSKYMGSYHGLGAGGSLSSETLTLDGAAFDPTTARIGNVFVLRNTTVATDGANSFTRDLTTTISFGGAVRYKINSISTSGTVSLIYLGMLIGTGAYDEADVQVVTNGPWLALPTLTATNDVFGRIFAQVVPKGIRLRDTVTGRAVTLVGSLISGLADYVQTELLREIAGTDRLKGYFGRFATISALTGAEWETNAAIVATGSQVVASNLFTNGDFATGDFTGWTRQTGAVAPTVVSGAMRQVREAAANHRMRQTNSFAVALSDVMAYRLDVVALSGGASPWARVSQSNALSFVSAMVDRQVTAGRWVFVFLPNINPIWAGIEHSLGGVADTLDTDNYWLGKLG